MGFCTDLDNMDRSLMDKEKTALKNQALLFAG